MDIESFIPCDKSWLIRMGVMDLLYGDHAKDILLLDSYGELGDDLKSLRNVLRQWDTTSSIIRVGESATLFRLIQFAIWKFNINKAIGISGTLIDRDICDNPDIINWSQEKLLTLDHGTSQWASASAICGDRERLLKPPYKLQVTYDAISQWNPASWVPRLDKTILNQAMAFYSLLSAREMDFFPEQPEDYCFARTFGYITSEKAIVQWPSLCGHESNRIIHMDEMLDKYNKGYVIESRDHRVVQAIAMKSLIDGKSCQFSNPNCVSKSWPKFWDFMTYVTDRK